MAINRMPERYEQINTTGLIVVAGCDRVRDILKKMPRQLTLRFRLLGLLPLIFFLAQTVHYWRVGGMGNLLWMCNVGNLLLAIGILFERRELIRAAAIWTIPGLGIWIRYVVFEYEYVFSSFLAHVGGITIGMIED